ncbi:MAG TPA: CoA-binding protein [Candidatus Binatus sp.]|nr:CoA-binding protein [Candidatus Binatus sp.]
MAELRKTTRSSTLNESQDIRRALRAKTIAVVGASKDPSKDSHTVAAYLKVNGYRIIPVNPTADRILDEECYKSLLDVPEEKARLIEVVDIFRPSQDIPPIVSDAIQLKKQYGHVATVWMQLGISNAPAAQKARDAGLGVVQDACIRIEHARTSNRENTN